MKETVIGKQYEADYRADAMRFINSLPYMIGQQVKKHFYQTGFIPPDQSIAFYKFCAEKKSA